MLTAPAATSPASATFKPSPKSIVGVQGSTSILAPPFHLLSFCWPDIWDFYLKYISFITHFFFWLRRPCYAHDNLAHALCVIFVGDAAWLKGLKGAQCTPTTSWQFLIPSINSWHLHSQITVILWPCGFSRGGRITILDIFFTYWTGTLEKSIKQMLRRECIYFHDIVISFSYTYLFWSVCNRLSDFEYCGDLNLISPWHI